MLEEDVEVRILWLFVTHLDLQVHPDRQPPLVAERPAQPLELAVAEHVLAPRRCLAEPGKLCFLRYRLLLLDAPLGEPDGRRAVATLLLFPLPLDVADRRLERLGIESPRLSVLPDDVDDELAADDRDEPVQRRRPQQLVRLDAIPQERHDHAQPRLVPPRDVPVLCKGVDRLSVITRHRHCPIADLLRAAGKEAFRLKRRAVDLVDRQHTLPHKQPATAWLIIAPHGQPQDRVGPTRRRQHGLAKTPAAEIFSTLAAAADVPPEPEELLPLVTRRRVLDAIDVAQQAVRPEVFVHKPPERPILIQLHADPLGIQVRIEPVPVRLQPRRPLRCLVHGEPHPRRLVVPPRIERVLDRLADERIRPSPARVALGLGEELRLDRIPIHRRRLLAEVPLHVVSHT